MTKKNEIIAYTLDLAKRKLEQGVKEEAYMFDMEKQAAQIMMAAFQPISERL